MKWKWVKTLILDGNDSINKRLETIILYLLKDKQNMVFSISDLDATGRLGNDLSNKCEEMGEIKITSDEFLELLKEDGQILELDLLISSKFDYSIVIRDGQDVDILGNGDVLPLSIIGNSSDLDVSLYNV